MTALSPHRWPLAAGLNNAGVQVPPHPNTGSRTDGHKRPESDPESGPESGPEFNPGLGLELQPMVHVEEMSAGIAFYEALGAHLEHGKRDGDYALLAIGATRFSLLAHPPNPDEDDGLVELNFQTSQPLTDVQATLVAAGLDIARPVTTTNFGRQLQILTPDGLLIKINELDITSHR